jgi:hypothetical protein
MLRRIGGGVVSMIEMVACISHIVSDIFGILFCSICIVGSGIRVGLTPKYVFALGPEMYYSKIFFVFLFAVCFWAHFYVFCSFSVTCLMAVLSAHL